MPDLNNYPRILLLTQNVFGQESGGGITLTNLFRGWPLERIAMIHADELEPDLGICNNLYKLSGDELVYLSTRIAGMLRSRVTRNREVDGNFSLGARSLGDSLTRKLVASATRFFFGLQAPSFGQLSQKLIDWVREFNPDIIYSFLGNLGYIQLAQKLQSHFHLPLAVHIMDDWPSTIYRTGIVSRLFRKKTARALSSLLKKTALPMGISPYMCEEYAKRYGRTFYSFHNPIDLEMWRGFSRREWSAHRPFRVLYSGSIEHNQVTALKEVCAAVSKLSQSGEDIEMHIHAIPYYVARYGPELSAFRGVELRPAPTRESIASILTEADLLVVAVNFDPAAERYFRYSMPTKLPTYMISGTPILLYGPPSIASIRYATEGRFGCSVTERGTEALTQAIKKIMSDSALREELGRKAVELAEKKHDALIVRHAFQGVLKEAARSR